VAGVVVVADCDHHRIDPERAVLEGTTGAF
jgi:hypothetical protein